MKTIRLFISAVLMCGFLGVSFAHAQEQDHAKIKLLREEAEAKLYKDLGLTDEQKKQMDSIKQAKMAEIKGEFTQMMDLNKQLNEALMNPNLDKDKINDINSQLKATQAKMMDARVNSILEIRKGMTPEQFKEFVTKTQGARDRFLKSHPDLMNKLNKMDDKMDK